MRRLLERLDVGIDYFDLIEVNEAFASQTIADGRALGMDWPRSTSTAAAIAMGHPIGCSPARPGDPSLCLAAAEAANRPGGTLCLGGSEAVALSVEMLH